MYTYWQIFKQAFKIILHAPALWFFGLLTVLLGSAGGLELVLSYYGFGGEGIMYSFVSGLIDGGLFTPSGLQGAARTLFINPVYLFIIILIFLTILALSILVLWLGTVSLTVLIGETINISQGKKIRVINAFRLGISKFWPVLGLNVLLRLASWFLIFILSYLTVAKFPGLLYVLIMAPLPLLAAILIVSYIGKYAVCGVVLRDWQFGAAIKSGWQVFAKNWLATLEISLLLFLIFLVANALLGYFLAIIFIFLIKIFATFPFALVLLFIIASVAFIAVQIFLVMFNWVVWAIVFELLTGKKKVLASFLARVFKRR